MNASADTLRKSDFETLWATLHEQQDRKVDLVTNLTNLCSGKGQVRVRRSDLTPILTDSGVDQPVEVYEPNEIFDDGLAGRLGIPREYLRTLRANGWHDLADQNINGLIHGRKVYPNAAPDGGWLREPKADRVMLRALRDADGGETGTARALLSSKYKIIDHIDTLLAALDGLKAAGLGADNITQCDLTGRRMYVVVEAPQVWALAPELLKNYTSPFTRQHGADNPKVHAGFVLSNSETGHGGFTLKPRIVVQVCTNGMTMNVKHRVFNKRHLGANLDDGLVNYSERTRKANRELITSQAADIVGTFLDVDYVKSVIRELEEKAGVEVTEPEKEIKNVTQTLKIPAQYDAVLAHFIKGGDLTRGGIMQAITAAAQSPEIDADTAFFMEEQAVLAL